ncbi:MAG: GNAT family protein [Henriciella sp.]|nr:GNAT family protein [Henriciella sp.]
MDLAAPGLESDLLRLDVLNEGHRATLKSSTIETALWLWMPAIPGGTHFDSYFDYMMKMQQAGMVVLYLLSFKSDGGFAGLTGFGEINRLHRRVRNLLAWYPPELFEPKLYLSSQLAMLRRAQSWGVRRIEWQLNTRNKFMLEQIERIGPKREAVLRNYERVADGSWTDKIVFSLIRNEIEEAAQRMEAQLVQIVPS